MIHQLDGEHLKRNIITTLETFIQSVLEYEENKDRLALNNPAKLAESLFSESLMFLFRILIVWLAESKGLLPLHDPFYRKHSLSYLLSKLKACSDEFSSEDTTSLWDELWYLFTILEKGVNRETLRMNPLGGRIFSKDALPILRKLSLSNKATSTFLAALFFTSTSLRDGVTKKEHLMNDELEDVMMLGLVHEVLLHLEPHVAIEDLVVVKVSSSKVKYVPLQQFNESDAANNEVLRRIAKGQFYFRNWNGTRKGSGTYYTPRELTEFLVESTLRPLVEGKTAAQILELKVLDPAVGSGAFLVAATLFLSRCYLQVSKPDSNPATEFNFDDEVRARQLIVKRCIFGVDVNPLAVELAKVALWLVVKRRNHPISIFDDNIRVGNSLLGFTNHLSKEEFQLIAKFGKENFFLQLTPEFVEGLPHEALKKLLDLVILSYLQPRLVLKIINSSIKPIAERNSTELKRVEFITNLSTISLDTHAVKRWALFHWELEFPNILARGGFDAIITNPPWNILKPNSNEFFSKFMPEFRTYKKKERLVLMNDLLKRDAAVKQQWEEYLEEIRSFSRFFKRSGLYRRQFRGDLNLYKLFLERSYSLLKEGGFFGLVVPSAIYTDLGSRDLRRLLLQEAKIRFLFSLENREGMFGIHKSYKVVLLVAQKDSPPPNHEFKVAFFVGSRPSSLKKEKLPASVLASKGYAPKLEELDELLLHLRHHGMTMSFPVVKQLNPQTLAFVEVKNEVDLSIVKKLHAHFPRFKNESRDLPWDVKLNREFDMTNDLSFFLTSEQARNLLGQGNKLPLETISLSDITRHGSMTTRVHESPQLLPLYEGKMIWQFNPFFAPARYWVTFPPSKPLKSLTNRKQLPYRAAFRAISGSTNERTLVSSVLPPAYHGNTLQSLMVTLKDSLRRDCNEEMIHLLASGMLNSFVLDWIVRLKVSSGLNYHFVHSLPFPRLTPKNAIFRQLIPRIARLSCIAPDFALLWEKTYRDDWMLEIHEVSALKDWKKLSATWEPSYGANDFIWFKDEVRDGNVRALLRAEIDVLMARLFRLDQEELLHMLGAFPVLQKKEIKYLGECRTKRLIMERWDDLQSL